MECLAWVVARLVLLSSQLSAMLAGQPNLDSDRCLICLTSGSRLFKATPRCGEGAYRVAMEAVTRAGPRGLRSQDPSWGG